MQPLKPTMGQDVVVPIYSRLTAKFVEFLKLCELKEVSVQYRRVGITYQLRYSIPVSDRSIPVSVLYILFYYYYYY